jgi:signal transduction histidine kinase
VEPDPLGSGSFPLTPDRSGRVDVTTERDRQRVTVTVRDTGEGIAADFIPYVFERFRQGDNSTTRRHGGLGLGLAIAQHVAGHGGSVEARSEGAGQGATFVLSLPLDVEAEPTKPPTRAQRTVDRSSPSTSS